MTALIPRRTAHSAAFVQQQNLVRGAFANRRKRGFNRSAGISPRLILRTNLRRVLLRTRAALDIDEFAEFLNWFGWFRASQLGGRDEPEIGFEYLNGVIDGPPIPLVKEIAWIVARLLLEAETLTQFRQSASRLDERCVGGRYEEALVILEEIVADHGESMWSVQLRFALEQRHNGLEAQKAYLELVRGKYHQGILAYVAYNTSVRNEERTSWPRFAEGIRTASARRKDKPLSDYLNYRLLGEWPPSAEGVSNVLRLEQSHSIIDLYETFVALCQLAGARDDLRPLGAVLQAAAEALVEIDDFRVAKIARAPTGRRRSDAVSIALANGDLAKALCAARSGPGSRSDPWAAIYHAAVYAFAKRKPRVANGIFGDLLVRLINPASTTTTDFREVEKLCKNFAGLPVARGVATFAEAIYPAHHNDAFAFKRIGLNSPPDGPEDEVGLDAVLGRPEVIDRRALALSTALGAMEVGEVQLARTALEPVVAAPKADGLQRLVDLAWLRCADAANDFAEVVATLSRIGSADPSQVPLLPIDDLIGYRRPQEYKAVAGGLAPLNALNMLWKAGDDEAAASTLKLMTGQFLRSRSESRPSLLADARPAFEPRELVYFLREVCVPNVLDVSRVFAGSREVQEERQAICAVLNVLDPEHSDQYSAEVAAITRRLKVDDGLKIVDQSRIHVDTDAVTRWARRNLSEDFARYVDLIEAGIGVSGNFDEALREIMEAVRSNKQGEFFTPQNEADNALIRLLKSLREEFLNSSTSGLDYFLSKRIRHISFIGLVRGPLEFSHLIANKPTAQSDYGPNQFWIDKLSTLNEFDRSRVDRAIRTFSQIFDDAVNRLKGELLHVRSTDHPSGIFDIPISTTVLTLARALVDETVSFDEFLESVYIIFWAVLETALVQARKIIDDELKMQIALAMDELKAEISDCAHDDPAWPELSAALAQAGTEVQSALSEASSWFTRPEIREVMRYFTLEEALDVAIESALKLHRGFTPIISRTVDGDVSLSAPDLVFITDAILVAFSNIKAYAKLDAPKVSVALKLDAAAET